MNRYEFREDGLFDKVDDTYISNSQLCNKYQNLRTLYKHQRIKSCDLANRLDELEDRIIILQNKYKILENVENDDVEEIKKLYLEIDKLKKKIKKADIYIKNLIKYNKCLVNDKFNDAINYKGKKYNEIKNVLDMVRVKDKIEIELFNGIKYLWQYPHIGTNFSNFYTIQNGILKIDFIDRMNLEVPLSLIKNISIHR